MDPDHPTVRFCSEGMFAEADGRLDDARRLFDQAWQARTDDYYASVAAHFVARQQESLREKLFWNELALTHAERVENESVLGFFPSLYLNIGFSHEQLGEMAQAESFYRMAEARLADQVPGPLADLVGTGVAAGLARVREQQERGVGSQDAPVRGTIRESDISIRIPDSRHEELSGSERG